MNRLQDARLDRGWSQTEVADQIGTTRLTISRWESGYHKPSPHFRRALTRLFGLSEEDLGLSKSADAQAISPSSPELLSVYDPTMPLLPPTQLVGREQDVSRIKEQLLKSESRVILTATTATLNGLPGVGKTALAIAIAHDPDVRDFFRDGILWAGLGPTPNLPGLMGRWARLLGLSESHFAELSEDQKRQALRAAIGSLRILIVLDDVWKRDEALALHVGGPNCASLLTTRFPGLATELTGDGVMSIEELNEEQSLLLLRLFAPSIVDREEAKVRQLVRAVGSLPLALTLLGNYLRKQTYNVPARRISAALSRLSEVSERFRISSPHIQAEAHPSIPASTSISLSSIIGVSDSFLTTAARSAFYALSVLPPKPESFSEEAALFVADCSTASIDELIDAGLLECNGERYRLHQVLADYARLQIDEQAAQQLTQRLVVYMQRYIEQHSTEYELLEQELTLLLFTLDLAVTHAAFQSQVVPLVCVSAPFLLMRGYYEKTDHFLDRALALATASDDSVGLATILLFLGEISQRQGAFPLAKERYSRGKELAERAMDIVLLDKLLQEIGRVCWIMGDYQEAETWLHEGLAIAREIGQPDLICDMCWTLAALYSSKSNYREAERYGREGLAIARELGDRHRIISLLINLGCGLAGRDPEKEILFMEAVSLSREIKSTEQYARALANLGEYFLHSDISGDLLRAEACAVETLSLARRLADPSLLCPALLILSMVLRKTGRLEEAQLYTKEGLTLAREMARTRLICIALYETGHIALAYGNADQALESFEEMYHLCPQGDDEIEATSLYGLARCYELIGQSEQALSIGKTALTMSQGMLEGKEIEQWYASLQADSIQASKASYCACGCGQRLPQPKETGRTKKYYSDSCRKRAQRRRHERMHC